MYFNALGIPIFKQKCGISSLCLSIGRITIYTHGFKQTVRRLQDLWRPPNQLKPEFKTAGDKQEEKTYFQGNTACMTWSVGPSNNTCYKTAWISLTLNNTKRLLYWDLIVEIFHRYTNLKLKDTWLIYNRDNVVRCTCHFP